jgi:hypothetical protein
MDNLYIIAKTQLQYNVGTCLGMFRCKQPFTPTHYQQRNYRLNSLTSLTS